MFHAASEWSSIMSSDKKMNWYPAVLVGLGGTGVRTLRYFKWLAEQATGDFGAAMRDGRFQLVAVDTDWKAQEEPTDTTGMVAGGIGGQAQATTSLPDIDVIRISTQSITNALSAIRMDGLGRVGEDFGDAIG